MQIFNSIQYELVTKFQELGSVVSTPETQELYHKLFLEETEEYFGNLPKLMLTKEYEIDQEKNALINIFDDISDMMVIYYGAVYHNTPGTKLMDDLITLAVKKSIGKKYDTDHNFNMLYVDMAFKEVMLSNLSKFCSTQCEADDTISSYRAHGVDTFYIKHNDKYVVKSAYNQVVDGKEYPEGKILKSVNWYEPNLEPIVVEYLLRV